MKEGGTSACRNRVSRDRPERHTVEDGRPAILEKRIGARLLDDARDETVKSRVKKEQTDL